MFGILKGSGVFGSVGPGAVRCFWRQTCRRTQGYIRIRECIDYGIIQGFIGITEKARETTR